MILNSLIFLVWICVIIWSKFKWVLCMHFSLNFIEHMKLATSCLKWSQILTPTSVSINRKLNHQPLPFKIHNKIKNSIEFFYFVFLFLLSCKFNIRLGLLQFHAKLQMTTTEESGLKKTELLQRVKIAAKNTFFF